MSSNAPASYRSERRGVTGASTRTRPYAPGAQESAHRRPWWRRVFGRIYEYFLGIFAMSEGQRGGEWNYLGFVDR